MPESPDVLIARAAVRYRAADYEAASVCALEIVSQAPEHFEALHLLGVLCAHWKRWADAVCYFARAVRLRSDHVSLNLERGNTFQAIKLFREAETVFRQILVSHPGHLDALNGLGIALTDQHREDEAIKIFHTALELDPRYAPVWFNLGKALAATDRLEEAAAAYRSVLAFASADTSPERLGDTATLLGEALDRLGRPEEALAVCLGVRARYPMLTNVTWNTSGMLLKLGDYAAGWRDYETRWQLDSHRAPRRGQTVVDIATVSGKRVLVMGEQGRGDIIQFVRYLPMLTARGATVTLSVYDDLKPLFLGMPGVERVIGEDENETEHDIVTSLLSLPLAFGTTLETIPAEVPYVTVDSGRTEYWRTRLGPVRGPRIGLAWRGMQHIAGRTAPLTALRSLLACRGVSFHALQKEITPNDRTWLEQDGRIADHSAELGDFADTAALVDHLDLIVTIDTSIAHLAGAMGKPVWIMLQYSADWRWGRDHEESVWYPTARLFRQTVRGNWDDVATRVAAALGERFPAEPD